MSLASRAMALLRHQYQLVLDRMRQGLWAEHVYRPLMAALEAVGGDPATGLDRQRVGRNYGFRIDALEPRLLLSTADDTAFVKTALLEITGTYSSATLTLSSQLALLGYGRGAVALNILGSNDANRLLVNTLYRQHLNRNADEPSLTNFANSLTAGTTTEESVITTLLTGGNEFSNHTDGTNKGFVDALYLDLLGRAADAGGEASWVAALNGGTSRSSVVTSFLGTSEFRGRECMQYFTTFLRRPISSTDAQAWMNGRGDLYSAKRTLVNTAEYISNCYPKWTISALDGNNPIAGNVTFGLTATQQPAGFGYSSWDVQWGDSSSTSAIPGTTSSVTHNYSWASNSYPITGTASLGGMVAALEPGVAANNWLNGNWSSSYTYNNALDIDGPFMVKQMVAPNGASITKNSSVSYAVSFSAAVSGIEVADFSLVSTGNLTGIGIDSISGSGTSYTITAHSSSGDGTLKPQLSSAFSITDSSNHRINPVITSNPAIIIDRTAPIAPSITAIAPDTGYSNSDHLTNSHNLTLSGTAEANSTISLTRGGVGVIGSTTASAGGMWSFSYAGTNLVDGTYTFTATATDVVGNSSGNSSGFTVVVDSASPMVMGVTSVVAAGTYTDGSVIPIIVSFSKAVYVTGTPLLSLGLTSGNKSLAYTGGSGTNTLTFNYTVAAGDTADHLDYASSNALNFNGGSIVDLAGNTASLTLTQPGAAGSLGANTALVIRSKPMTPANFLAVASTPTAMSLSWNSGSANQTGFTIERSLDGSSFAPIATALSANTTTYLDSTISANVSYYYRIKASNTLGDSTYATLGPVSASTHTISWVGATAGNWNTAANWSTGVVPGLFDDVVINGAGNPTVTFSSGNATVHSLLTNCPLTLSGGTLTVTSTAQVNNTLSITGGTLAKATVSTGTGGAMVVGSWTSGTLDSVTLAVNLAVQVGGTLTVRNGLTLVNDATVTVNDSGNYNFYTKVNFEGSQSLTGSGFLQFTGAYASVNINGTSTTPALLTIGSGITLSGQQGSLNNNAYGSYLNQGTIRGTATVPNQNFFVDKLTNAGLVQGTVYIGTMQTNSGTLQVSSVQDKLSIGGTGWVNSGFISVVDGTLTLDGSWSNTGTISHTGGTLSLSGQFTTASLGTITQSGGTTQLKGILDNTNMTLALSASTGSWILDSGTIVGGAVTGANGAGLQIAYWGTGTLDHVTLAADLSVLARGTLTVKNGLTLANGATVTVIDSGNYNYYSKVNFEGGQSLAGSGLLQLAGSDTSVNVNGTSTNPALLTIGRGITISGHGELWSSNNSNAYGRYLNQGSIIATGTNQNLYVSTLTNEGLLQGTVNVGVMQSNSGTIRVAASTDNLTIGGTGWTNTGSISVAEGTLNLNGSWHNTQEVEVLGAGKLNLFGHTIQARAYAISGTEIGVDSANLLGTTISASTDGSNYLPVGSITANSTTNILENLHPNTQYQLQVTLPGTDGGSIVYRSLPLATLNEPDRSGYYRVAGIKQGSTNITSVGSWNLDTNWTYTGSPNGLVANVLSGLVSTGANTDSYGVPLPVSDGSLPTLNDSVTTFSVGSGGGRLFHADLHVWGRPFNVWTTNYQIILPYAADPNVWGRIDVYDLALEFQQATVSFNLGAGNENPNSIGPDTQTPAATADPVRYFDGSVEYRVTDLQSNGLGDSFGQTRSWNNQGQLIARNVNGHGMIDSQITSLVQVNGDLTLVVVTDGTMAQTFNTTTPGGSYVAVGAAQDTLVHGTGQFLFTDSTGNQITFYDFSDSVPANLQGQFLSKLNRSGVRTYVYSANAAGNPTEIRRQDAFSVDAESWRYTYLPDSDPNAGLLANVQLRQPDGSGGWSVVRQVAYTYYDGVAAFGNLGDLQTAVIEDAAGNPLDTTYYRYYTAGETNGYGEGLKYVLNANSYARLAAAVTDPFTAAESVVAPLATHYFQYDSEHRVTLHRFQGAGSSENGGLGTFTYQYDRSSNPEGTNSWQYKTIETLPDGNQNIIYCNSLGEVMLKVFHDISDLSNAALNGKQWYTFYKYDAQGRVLWQADSSAVTGYDETKADLLCSVSGNYQYLADTAGVIQVTDYYTTTTASGSVVGSVRGYVQDQALQHGELGTPVIQQSKQYVARSANGITIYPEATNTVYRNADGTGAETTSYSYMWSPGTLKVLAQTTTLPMVTVAQNGAGFTAANTLIYDAYGRVIWSKDGAGFISHTTYDLATGAVLAFIQDVDYAKLSAVDQTSFALTGWAQPFGGLHLVTTSQVDALGRTTKRIDPNGMVTYTVYNDAVHEMRAYRGWNAATCTATGPIEVTRNDRTGSYSETLTMDAVPHTTLGVPDGTEAITNLQSLIRNYYNSSDQLIASDAYFDLSGLVYSSAGSLGTLGTHYYRTRYGYDILGQRNHVVNAVGTITDTVYDSLGRPTGTYVGTNDSTTDGHAWTPTNGSANSNMALTSQNQYDWNEVGAGNLTQVTHYRGGGLSAGVNQYAYDWRGRLVFSKNGVEAQENTDTNRPITYIDYDNLGEVVARETYDGDGVLGEDINQDGVPDRPAAGLLRAKQQLNYDNQGRLYQTTTLVLDQTLGQVTASPQIANTWYDYRGLVIETLSAAGQVTKMTYDGAGRLQASYVTDGAGNDAVGTVNAWNQAQTVSNDHVWQQTEYTYDADGNVIFSISKLRNNGATETGSLTGSNARITYSASYYDALNRNLATVNVGTNGGMVYVRPATAPNSNAETLVTSSTYNAAGRLETRTDPRGIVSKYQYDALGRLLTSIAGYTDGIPTVSSNLTTRFTYDGLGHVVTQTKVQVGEVNQITQYVYGVTGDLNDNDLLQAVQLPDALTGMPSLTNQTRYAYDLAGELLTTTSANGAITSNTYDVLGRLRSTTITTTDDSGNPQTLWDYDVLGQVARTTDPNGHATTLNYNSLGEKLRVVQPDPDGQGAPTTTYSYDAAGNLLSVTDARQNTTQYLYDLLNRRIQTTLADPDGLSGSLVAPVIHYQYNLNGQSDRTIDALGNVTTTVYDALGRVHQTIQPSPDGTVPPPTTTYGYDQDNNVTTVTDARGNTTTTVYDQLNRSVEMIGAGPAGPTDTAHAPITFYVYDAVGNLRQITDPLGHVTNYEYDALNRKTAWLQPLLAGNSVRPTSTYAYDVAGNLIGTIDPMGNQTTSLYNQLNRKIQQTEADPDGGGPLLSPVTSYEYDLNGNLVTVVDPLNQHTSYQYDALNRKTQVTQPAAQTGGTVPTTHYAYDKVGNLVTLTDTLGYTTAYAYDQLNRKIQVTEPDPDGNGPETSAITTYQYDANNNLVATTNALGNAPGGNSEDNTTTYAYDHLNRQILETDPLSSSGTHPATSYTYDEVGNLKTRTDADQNITTYHYDGLNRVDSVTNQHGDITTTVYDAAGNVISMTDKNGRTTAYVYDALNREIAENWLDGSNAIIHTISYVYDADGRLTSASDPDSTTVYNYDHLSRVTDIQINYTGMTDAVVLHQVFDAVGERTSFSSNIGVTADFLNSYVFDNLGRVTRIQQSGQGGNAVASKQVSYQYNLESQVTSVQRYADLTGTNLVASTSFDYDQAHQLLNLTHALGALGTNVLAYGFGRDVAGRITTFTTPDGSSTLTYDNTNQLTSASATSETYTYDAAGNRTNTGYHTNADNQLETDGTYSYTYDANGNRRTRTRLDGTETVTYTWDYRNRLTEVVSQDGSAVITQHLHYAYDSQNRRILKQVLSPADASVTQTERYIYDGLNLVLVLNSTGQVQERFLQGTSTNEVLAQETVTQTGTDVRWALTDHEGSIRDVLDNAGTVQDHIIYDSFGNIQTQTVPGSALRMGYTGYIYDPETGLNYANARYYDPAVSQFISTDPSGFAAGDNNLYRYVGNNPVNDTDPTGLCKESDWETRLNNGEFDGVIRSAIGPDLSWSPDLNEKNKALESAQDIMRMIESGFVGGPGATQLLQASRDRLVAAGFDAAAVAQSLEPYGNILVKKGIAKLEAGRWYTSGERLQGSLSILANSMTFGYSDAKKWTDTAKYHGDTFTGAYASASCVKYAEAGVITIGGFSALGVAGSWASTHGALGAMGGGMVTGTQIVAATGGGYLSGKQVYQGVNLVANGDYVNGFSEMTIGAGSLGLMGIGIVNPNAIGGFKYNPTVPNGIELPSQPSNYPMIDLVQGSNGTYYAPTTTQALNVPSTNFLSAPTSAWESSVNTMPSSVGPPLITSGSGYSVDAYIASLPQRLTPTNSPADLYEIAHTGPFNYLASGGGSEYWMDGYNGTAMLDAKHVGNISRSPFIPDSVIPENVRQIIINKQLSEFKRASAVINDPSNPMQSLTVITNHPDAAKMFEYLMKQAGTTGSVIIKE